MLGFELLLDGLAVHVGGSIRSHGRQFDIIFRHLEVVFYFLIHLRHIWLLGELVILKERFSFTVSPAARK